MTVTTRLDVLLHRLERGPATTAALAKAIGCDPSQVPKYVERLKRRGYGVLNTHPKGSKAGAEYVLVRRPSAKAMREALCLACNRPLAADHADDDLCSPCRRAAADGELAGTWPETLPGVVT